MADTKWYTLRVISGQEKKLKGILESEIQRSGWQDTILQILLPVEKVYQIKKGKKTIKEKNLFPGYMFVEAAEDTINADMIASIRSYTGVIGFLGKQNPIAMKDDDANRMLGKMDEMKETGAELMNEPFILNETVKIIDGAFNDFHGTVEEIFDDKKRLKVIVKIFGRRTPVELNFIQVEKVS